MPAPERGREQFDVEADVGVRAWGPTRSAAFAEAALGVLALIVDPSTVEPREHREVRAQADSLEALLVAWIDECLYVHEIEGFAARSVDVEACTDTLVHGRLVGEPLEPGPHRLGTVVKAATHHGVEVRSEGQRHEVRVIVDV
jgi:SHS2 domain-containing protein